MKRICNRLFAFLLFAIFGVTESLGMLPSVPDYSVGSIKGNAGVNAMGAATYDFLFSVPNGGALTPQVGLAYSSQNGNYGIAGYGFDVTGISVITSGGKDIYHDGEMVGVHYDASSSLYLDGKRLILKSGSLADGNAVYDVEESPLTTVTAIGKFDSVFVSVDSVPITQSNGRTEYYYTYSYEPHLTVSFIVCSPDGTSYEYGTSESSQLSFNSYNHAFCAAWYITRAKDKYGNCIDYSYSKGPDHRIYPSKIQFGVTYNSTGIKIRDTDCSVSFVYDELATFKPSFYVGSYKVTTTKKLKEVECKEGNQLFRKYTFAYTAGNDTIGTTLTKLTGIVEYNNVGESFPPITLCWDEISPINMSRTDIGTSMNTMWRNNTQSVSLDKKCFFSFDVNNDGLSDLIRIDEKEVSHKNRGKISINLAQKDTNGNISFSEAQSHTFEVNSSNSSGTSWTSCGYPVDIDGDGVNEIIEHSYYKNETQPHIDYRIFKYTPNFSQIYTNTIDLSCDKSPLMAAMDWNGDGKPELLFLETSPVNYNNRLYRLHVVNKQDSENDYQYSYTLLNIDGEPKKVFSNDYDNDGREDLMVLTSNSYSIFSHAGLGSSGSATDLVKYSNIEIKDKEIIKEGDFNEDGLTDFVFFLNDNNVDKYRIAFSKGNGYFDLSEESIIPISISKDNNIPTLRAVYVFDINGDGKSDIMSLQNGWVLYAGSPMGPIYQKKTITSIFISNGNELQLYSTRTDIYKDNKYLTDDFIFLSDFDGDGFAEIANYGTRLDEDNSTSYDNTIHVYKNSALSNASKGKLVSICDGLGVSTYFTYDNISNPNVYEKGTGSFPVSSFTLPLTVVTGKKTIVGHVTTEHETYSYKDLKFHKQGKGILGFTETIKEDCISHIVTNSKIYARHHTYFFPTRTTIETRSGSDTTIYETIFSYHSFDNQANYLIYPILVKNIDIYGNITTTSNTYDVNFGLPIRSLVTNGNGMYKKEENSNYIHIAGVWLPQTVTNTQKHEDCDSVYSFVRQYTYDNVGNVTRCVEGVDKTYPLITTSTYDSYGNVLSKTGIKAGKTITEFFEYDTTGRYITKAYQSPDMGCKLYKYDYFGNVIEERDSINADHVLITRHEYDGWGRRTKTVHPDNTFVEYSIAWNDGGGYKTVESPNNAPSITTVFDALGRKLSESTKGRKGIDIVSFTEYNSKGQIASVSKTEGDLTVGTSYTYDSHGRKTREESTSGAITTYDYGNRCITTSNGVTSVTSTYDAWGNVVESVDSLCTVTYTYGSHGSPVSISLNGHTVYMEYDDMGYRTSLTDPDAGTMAYTYTKDGVVLSQTDGRGIRTNFMYDNSGRLSKMQRSNIRYSYNYDTSGYGKYLLGSKSLAADSVTYEYDRLRRVTKEHRKFGSKIFDKSYEYNALGNVSKVTYPGGLEVTYTYDALGFLDSVYANDSLIYHLNSFNGLTETISGVGGLKLKDSYDSYGFLTNKEVFKANNHSILSVGLTYNRMTGNVASRDILVSPEYADGGGIHLNDTDTADTQTIDILSITSGGVTNPIGPPINIRADRDVYTYDSMDRLITVTKNNRLAMAMEYDDCGNITYKTGIGEYTYDESCMPHAVMEVENRDGSAGSQNMLTSYHINGKLESIVMDSLELVNTYRFDDEKWESQLLRNDSIIRTVLYFDDFEEITENNGTYLQYFLENNVIVIKRNGSFEYYQGFTDHLGNILDVYDSNGHAVFEARYDAWGKQTITRNDIGLRYGYTGHEMLPEFGLIDMKGRVYDPALGRFLSPDNYVQEPTNSQSFNRYSYCVNNPLKYTDPTGELAWFIPVIAGAIIGAYTGASIQSHTVAFWKWKSDSWKGAIVGGIIGATLGYNTASILSMAQNSCISGMVMPLEKTYAITKTAGLTGSILMSGSTNLAINALFGGGLDSAWKSGLTGLFMGVWSTTGGFGLAKASGTTSKTVKLIGKLGYQMVGTVGQSIGNNWAAGRKPFSRVTLGLGPINLTLGKNQKILQLSNNMGNFIFNMLGLANLAFAGGSGKFDRGNLTMVYSGGLRDKWFHDNTALGCHTIFMGNQSNSNDYITDYSHELVHLWQSRAMIDSFLPNYLIQGINSFLMKGNFIDNMNYYEQIGWSHEWF